MAWYGRDSIERLLDPHHLVVETHRENMKRMQCNRRLACICQGFPDCIFDDGKGELLYNEVEAIFEIVVSSQLQSRYWLAKLCMQGVRDLVHLLQ